MSDLDPVDDMTAALRSAMAALDLRLDSASGAHVFNGATALDDLARSLLARRVLAPSPETTPAGVLALDAERLRKAIDLSGIGIAEGGHAASEWADAVAREYNRLGGAPKEDWQCETVGCYLHVGHASEHEPGMCECGADMEAHSGGWTLLHHDQFMEGFLAAALGRSGSGGGRG